MWTLDAVSFINLEHVNFTSVVVYIGNLFFFIVELYSIV